MTQKQQQHSATIELLTFRINQYMENNVTVTQFKSQLRAVAHFAFCIYRFLSSNITSSCADTFSEGERSRRHLTLAPIFSSSVGTSIKIYRHKPSLWAKSFQTLILWTSPKSRGLVSRSRAVQFKEIKLILSLSLKVTSNTRSSRKSVL